MTKKEIIREHYTKIGRKGGLKGGKTRTDAMTAEERTELARMAARARWGKKTPGTKAGKEK
jgi:hypothetical protein